MLIIQILIISDEFLTLQKKAKLSNFYFCIYFYIYIILCVRVGKILIQYYYYSAKLPDFIFSSDNWCSAIVYIKLK